MPLVDVEQRSDEWYRRRKALIVTASRFGDVIGAGVGTPYDFYQSVVEKRRNLECAESNSSAFTQHGVEVEPAIDEAYAILTGRTPSPGRFFVPADSSLLAGLVGASPDGLLLDEEGTIEGIVEYKAPVFDLYDGIPAKYMAQIQGQMGIIGCKWCDFMVVCMKTQSITLHRVPFSRAYWSALSAHLKRFCSAVRASLADTTTTGSSVEFLRRPITMPTVDAIQNRLESRPMLCFASTPSIPQQNSELTTTSTTTTKTTRTSALWFRLSVSSARPSPAWFSFPLLLGAPN